MLEFEKLELRVRDLDRVADFYVRRLGFTVLSQQLAEVRLAVAPDQPALLTLLGDLPGKAPPPDAAGLFHAALLFPDRGWLAQWIRHAVSHQVEFDGFSDHGVSEAVYLSDPEGNGLEFYADRRAEEWPRQNGAIAMFTRPLDVRALLREAPKPDPSPLTLGCRWGHLHLRVTDLDRSQAFYQSSLGLEVTQADYPGARFLAAEGYHHHLGLNTWSRPRQPKPDATLGFSAAHFRRDPHAPSRPLKDPDNLGIVVS